MFIVRDIFHLKFGHYKDAKALFDEAKSKNMFPEAQQLRMLTDFTGDSYRLILEQGHDSLAAYEKNLSEGMGQGDWKQWYENFKSHVIRSHREILKQVM
ncbi:MAG: hypothetical protein M3004_12250 [Bacteroidota bacterium]|nr:hypothetical protein [Bacteroidota bacterium]